MEAAITCYDTLKAILKNIRNPALLDDHPWTHSLIVQERYASARRDGAPSPGHQLLEAIACLFAEMQPPTPPRRGKRLDPRWGEFGLLASLYFTPFRQGTAFPVSLLDAWKRIDTAILYHVFGKPPAMLTREQIERYQLVGEEIDYGSTSTLSDWHRKGVQRLAEIVVNRERSLSTTTSRPATIVHEADPSMAVRPARRGRRSVWLVSLAVLFGLLLVAGLKSWEVYGRGRAVVEDVSRLQQETAGTPDPETLAALYPSLLDLKQDLASLQQSVGPLAGLGPSLGWVPGYGGDLAAAPALLQVAGHLVDAADLAYQGAGPLLEELGSKDSSLDPAGLTSLLAAAGPQLSGARLELDQALEARRQIDASLLSPRVQDLLVRKVDPVLERADEGLSLAAALPVLLGASAEGPKTYLLLAQNEDELRATGGFITSVGRLVIQDGQILSMEFEQVDNQEDWSKPYPAAPWQMREYMNSRVMLLRDANWSPDFPTSAQMAETLYAYNHSLSVDGVIAFDQQFLVLLLRHLGPLQVEGAPEPVTADNVIAYMRAAKKLPAGQPVPPGWHRKEFMNRITAALLTELAAGKDHNWRGIAETLSQGLEERHLLLQFDNPLATGLLARQGWDNSLHPGSGDFLMVADTNMGFNKTNAAVEEQLSYVVDLTDPARPQAFLTVTHANNSAPGVPCIHWNTGEIQDETSYPIDRCYWNYLRVYKQAGAALLESQTHAVPAEWMLLNREVPAQVDLLDENLPGIQGLGTLLIVPGGQMLNSQFHFSLPAPLLSEEGEEGQVVYHLDVRKQPGTLAVPLEITVKLPENAELVSLPAGAAAEGNQVQLKTSLRTDVSLDVSFRLP